VFHSWGSWNYLLYPLHIGRKNTIYIFKQKVFLLLVIVYYLTITSSFSLLFFHLVMIKQIDVWGIRTPFLFLEWIGMNAMLVYVLAAEGIFAAFVNGWYYEDPEKSLVRNIETFYIFIVYAMS